MELLSTISTAVNVVDSKLTQVIAAVQQLSDRQDRLEASIVHIKTAVSHLRPAATVSQPTPTAVSQPPPATVTQSTIQAPHSLSHYQAGSTPAFAHPSSAWYHTSSSFVEPVVDGKEYLDHNTILQLRRRSASRKNFASLISRDIFTEQERLTCNVNGQGKPKLDEKRIAYVKKVTLQFWPLIHTENIEKEWAECVIAIDEANRRMKRNK